MLYVQVIDESRDRSPRGEADTLEGALECARQLCQHLGATAARISGLHLGEPAAWTFHAEWLEEAEL